MKIEEFIFPELVSTELKGKTKIEILDELSRMLSFKCNAVESADIAKVLIERERLASTGIGEGVAIPHGKMAGVEKVYAALGLTGAGVDFESIDGKPVNIFIALLAPENSTGDHLKALARVSRVFRDRGFRQKLLKSQSSQEAYAALKEADESHS